MNEAMPLARNTRSSMSALECGVATGIRGSPKVDLASPVRTVSHLVPRGRLKQTSDKSSEFFLFQTKRKGTRATTAYEGSGELEPKKRFG